MIQNEVFDHLFAKLAGLDTRRACDVYQAKRFNRARLALACQNYFFGTEFRNVTGAAGITFTDQTAPVERRVIIRGGGLNARSLGPVVGAPVDVNVGLIDINLFRSGSSKAQISKIPLRSSAYVSDGEAQPWELDWPVPWTLDPNELIQVKFTQITATPANTLYAVNFYGVAVDPKYRCDPAILQSLKAQIRDTEQRTIYLNVKSEDSGGTIMLGNVHENAVTDEAQEHLLVIGFRRNANDYLPGNTTFKLAGSDGRAFSRNELVVKGFEFYNTPDSGYFRFAVPHLIRKGQSITASLSTDPLFVATLRNSTEAEINLICVTV